MDDTINDFLKDLESHQNYSENTYQAYRMDLSRFTGYLITQLGRKPSIRDLSTTVISDYLEAEKKHGYKPSTLYRRRSSLRKFSQYLMESGIINDNLITPGPFLKAKERRNLAGRKKIDSLSFSEVSSLLHTLSGKKNPRAKRDLAIIMLLLETGISIGELIQIDQDNVNFVAKKISIKRKGHTRVSLNIPMSASVIEEYLKIGRPELTQSRVEAALFVSQLGGRITRQGVWQMIKKIGKQTRLKKTVSPRVIRHTAARQMLVDGRSLKEIQVSLGHHNKFSTRSLVRRLK